MNGFFKGLLVGMGVGLLVAPMRGEEMRRLLSQRLEEVRGYLPESDQLNQSTQQISDRVSQTAGNLKDYAQQAATTAKSTANNLSDIAQSATSTVKNSAGNLGSIAKNATSDVKQTAKETAKDTTDMAKQSAKSAATSNSTTDSALSKQATQATQTSATNIPSTTAEPFPAAYPEYVSPEVKKNPEAPLYESHLSTRGERE